MASRIILCPISTCTNLRRWLHNSWEEQQHYKFEERFQTDTLLLGRRTYLRICRRQAEHARDRGVRVRSDPIPVQEEIMMGKVILAISISLDGYIAGPGDEGERLHRWVFGGEPDGRLPPGHYPQAVADADVLAELFAFHVPCFVLSHRKREKLIKGGGTTFTFVTEGIVNMLSQAQDVSGAKQVCVLGGASLARQCIQAGLLDEIQLPLVPVLLGEGLSLFDRLRNAPLELEVSEVVRSPCVTYLRFRVRKQEGASQDRLE